MNFHKLLSHIAVAIVALALSASVVARGGILSQLPTIRVNGKIMYYYDTRSGDNLYTVAEKLGVSVKDIRACNPSVADGIKPRMRLFFPTDMASSQTGDSAGPLTHVVQKNESIYGIARHYGITMERLTALNPSISNGIRPGMRLRLSDDTAADTAAAAPSVSATLPAEEEPTAEQPVAVEPIAEEPVAEEPVAVEPAGQHTSPNGYLADNDNSDLPDMALPQPAPALPADSAENALTLDSAGLGIDVDASEMRPINIAVILPFLLEESHMGRQTQLYTEFYKGFLLAADTLNLEGRTPVKIHAYDSAASLDTVRALMSRPEMASMDLFVAPDNPSHLSAISAAAPAGALILNTFAVKDSSYETVPGMIQANIPHDEMYERAIAGFIDLYPEAIPVFLSRNGGRTDKEEFTSQLKSALSGKGVAYRTLHFDGYLSDADLEQFDPETSRYVFIPSSGNREEFNHIIHALKSLKGRALDPSAVQLFGYPEWATYRGSQLDEICDLQTSIYTRYCPTENDADATRLNEAFRRTYGEGLIDKQMPVLGILGFDTGMMAIEGLRTMAGTGSFPSVYNGIQSGLSLRRAEGDGGLYNDAIYIITFHPGGSIDKTLK